MSSSQQKSGRDSALGKRTRSKVGQALIKQYDAEFMSKQVSRNSNRPAGVDKPSHLSSQMQMDDMAAPSDVDVGESGEIEYLPNGLPKNYNSMARPGVPDGSDPNNPVIVYADGVFDMYHVGHAKVLEQAKKLFKHTYLIVGVSGDKETIEKKGKIVMNEKERCEILEHCRWVDEVLCPCPWVLTVDFLKEKGIHYVAHDDLPYGSVGQQDIYYEVKKNLMFRATQRTEGISTSDIILRLIKDYDLYVQRSFERGYKRQDLGISASKAFRMKMKHELNKYKEYFIKKQIKKDSSGSQGSRKKNTMQSIIDMFQNLEFQTEKVWHDFTSQYAPRRQLKQDDKKKKFIESATEGEGEGEDNDSPRRIKSQQNSFVNMRPPVRKSMCQRFFSTIYEQLEMGNDQPAVDDDDVQNFQDDESSDHSEHSGNKRQQKQIRKSMRERKQ